MSHSQAAGIRRALLWGFWNVSTASATAFQTTREQWRLLSNIEPSFFLLVHFLSPPTFSCWPILTISFGSHHLRGRVSIANMSHEQEHLTDSHVNRQGYITGNDFALPYVSKWSGSIDEDTLAMLSHVNCCFLSRAGTAPTLLALKMHAQSLCRLIERLQHEHTAAFTSTKSSPSAVESK